MGDEGKIFVGGLHWNTTTEGLRAYFEQFGQVVDCNIMRDPTGRSRCFGFVTFADPMVVDVALQKTHILDKKQIDPKRAIPKDQPHPTPSSSSAASLPHSNYPARGNREEHKVFVGGIHVEADEMDLKEAMQQHDEVLETILMRDRETGRSRGFGFVTFATLDGAQKACGDTELRIRGRKVEVKMAVPKGRQTGAPKAPEASPSADPYAAWAEYFKQYPEYYEAMMKAYSNPSAMAAYYSQYYGAAGQNATSNVPTESPLHQTAHTSPNYPLNSPYYPADAAAASAPGSGPAQTIPQAYPGGGAENDPYRVPEEYQERSRARRRSRSRSQSGSRGRSASRRRNASGSPGESRSRSRSQSRSNSRSGGGDRDPEGGRRRSRSPERDPRERTARPLERRDYRGRDHSHPTNDGDYPRDRISRIRENGYGQHAGTALEGLYGGEGMGARLPRAHPGYPPYYSDHYGRPPGGFPSGSPPLASVPHEPYDPDHGHRLPRDGGHAHAAPERPGRSYHRPPPRHDSDRRHHS